MERNLKEQLRHLKHDLPLFVPDKNWVNETRESVGQGVRSTGNIGTPVPVASTWARVSLFLHAWFPTSVMVMARRAAVFFLVGSVAVGGWIVSASASQNSLPGERLYNVKLAIEKTEVAMADVVGSQEVAVSKELDFAARRVHEVQSSPEAHQKVVALQSLQKSISSTRERLAKTEQEEPEKAVAVAKVVNEKTDQILRSLDAEPNVPDAPSSPAQQAADGVKKEVQETQKLIEDTGVRAVKVLLEKGNAETVKDTVEKRLEKIVTDLVDIHQNATEVGVIVTSSSTALSGTTTSMFITPSTTLSSASTTIALSSSTTTGILTTSTTVSTTVGVNVTQEVKQVQQKIEQAGTQIEQAKNLIEHNNLREAIEKVEELYQIKNEAKITVNQLEVVKSMAAPVLDVGVKPALSVSTSTVSSGTTTIPILAPVTPTTTR